MHRSTTASYVKSLIVSSDIPGTADFENTLHGFSGVSLGLALLCSNDCKRPLLACIKTQKMPLRSGQHAETDLETTTCAFSVGVSSARLGCVALIAGAPAGPVAVAAGWASPIFRSKQAWRKQLLLQQHHHNLRVGYDSMG